MKKDLIIVLLVISFCFFVFDYCQAFYQWTDENGVVHYGDAPPEGVDNAIEKTETGAVIDPHDSEKSLPAAGMEELDSLPEAKNPAPQVPIDIKEVIGTLTLAPHSREEISFVAFEPVKIGFTTDITPETVAQCKNSGAGIKDRYSSVEAISPYAGSCEFKPKDGYIKFYVGNLENFPITIKVFKR